ncbi:hypothetical protein O6H91_04G028500 [Diphasiastrum complanatum]|uniref:Uncharacterized protein n=1 Tax=Diphasiastrum complanatum TaxID=34168 RepID=A0ACC2DVB8_DIPCM|nr:hypothetical protein O6H91_04G028500 [Diphasiastrum complanatum]
MATTVRVRGRWRWQLLIALTSLALLALTFVSHLNPQLGLLGNHPRPAFLPPADSRQTCDAANACTGGKSSLSTSINRESISDSNGSLELVDRESVEPAETNQLAVSASENVRGVPSLKKKRNGELYYNWKLFEHDYKEMLQRFRIYVYQDVYNNDDVYANVFMRHKHPYDPKLGNYFSEHMFKINLLDSHFLTSNPSEANLFYLPFSINVMRNDPRIRSDTTIPEFVAKYVERITREFDFWNKSHGADHFYVCCHSVGKEASAKSPYLQRNAMQVACSSNNYHKFYVPHKDVPLAQVWPRPPEPQITPPKQRKRLAFYAGRAQNSRVRSHLISLWGNDTDMDIYADKIRGSYPEAFRRSKYCLHVKGDHQPYGYSTVERHTAVNFGCIIFTAT